jgi:hypothetical protein
LTQEEFNAESDKSPGVLLSSGYIAGAAIAGIVIAIMQMFFDRADAAITAWSTARNPFFDGPWSDLLSTLPFLALCVLLYLVGREKWLKPGSDRQKGE